MWKIYLFAFMMILSALLTYEKFSIYQIPEEYPFAFWVSVKKNRLNDDFEINLNNINQACTTTCTMLGFEHDVNKSFWSKFNLSLTQKYLCRCITKQQVIK